MGKFNDKDSKDDNKQHKQRTMRFMVSFEDRLIDVWDISRCTVDQRYDPKSEKLAYIIVVRMRSYPFTEEFLYYTKDERDERKEELEDVLKRHGISIVKV